MARIDSLYLAREGIPISRERVRNLMRRMGFRANDQKPRTKVPGDPSERLPYLVDASTITAVDKAWATEPNHHHPVKEGIFSI